MTVDKGFQEMLAEANAVIKVVSPTDAIALTSDSAVFIDVRETDERRRGHIPGSAHAPRGFLEFIADPRGPMHNPVFTSGRHIVVYCASGGRSTLAAKTLVDMGFKNVFNLVGGFQGWLQAGGSVDDGS